MQGGEKIEPQEKNRWRTRRNVRSADRRTQDRTGERSDRCPSSCRIGKTGGRSPICSRRGRIPRSAGSSTRSPGNRRYEKPADGAGQRDDPEGQEPDIRDLETASDGLVTGLQGGHRLVSRFRTSFTSILHQSCPRAPRSNRFVDRGRFLFGGRSSRVVLSDRGGLRKRSDAILVGRRRAIDPGFTGIASIPSGGNGTRSGARESVSVEPDRATVRTPSGEGSPASGRGPVPGPRSQRSSGSCTIR